MKANHALPSSCVQLRGPNLLQSIDTLVGCLKRNVSRQLTAEYGSRVPAALFRRAVDDAEELARNTEFPHLVFPSLAEEKVRILSNFLSPAPSPRQPGELQAA